VRDVISHVRYLLELAEAEEKKRQLEDQKRKSIEQQQKEIEERSKETNNIQPQYPQQQTQQQQQQKQQVQSQIPAVLPIPVASPRTASFLSAVSTAATATTVTPKMAQVAMLLNHPAFLRQLGYYSPNNDPKLTTQSPPLNINTLTTLPSKFSLTTPAVPVTVVNVPNHLIKNDSPPLPTLKESQRSLVLPVSLRHSSSGRESDRQENSPKVAPVAAAVSLSSNDRNQPKPTQESIFNLGHNTPPSQPQATNTGQLAATSPPTTATTTTATTTAGTGDDIWDYLIEDSTLSSSTAVTTTSQQTQSQQLQRIKLVMDR
jgi:hypothetical protein